MASTTTKNGYWTFEQCAEMAAQCSTRMEFHGRSSSAYTIASRNGWLSTICAHMPVRSSRPRRWTPERIADAVKSCTTLAEFQQRYPSISTILSKKGRFHDVTSGLARADRNPNGYWTKDRCKEAADQCVTRSDFIKRFPSAYDAAHRYGWLDDVCADLQRVGNHKLRAIYVIKVRGANAVYVGLSAHPRRRYATHHISGKDYVRALLSKPHRFRVIGGYRPVGEAVALEKRLIAHFQRKGWAVANRHEGGQTGRMPKKWTKAALQQLADTVETRGQMMREHLGAYCAACDAKVLDDIFAKHRNRGFGDGPIRDWTPERLRDSAAQVPDRPTLKRANPKAWQAAYRKGLLDAIFSDHPNEGRGRKAEWSADEIAQEAGKYGSPKEFRRGNRRAHHAAERRGLLPHLFGEQRRTG